MTLANLKIFLENAKKKEDTALVKMLEERIKHRLTKPKYANIDSPDYIEPPKEIKPKPKEKKDDKGSA